MKDKKCLLIVPYFGKFNNYYQLFLNSIANLQSFDFLIVTDDKRKFINPQNVTCLYMSFEDLKERIAQKMGFSYPLSHPQKLCDYKPVYGEIFDDYVKNYQYWGFCDIDCIYGDLDKLVAPLMEEHYDKIFNLGHLTLIKNDLANNKLYKKFINPQNGGSPIFSTEVGMKFDEEYGEYSINRQFVRENKSIYSHQLGADIYTKANRFYLHDYDFQTNKHQLIKEENLFVYSNGKVFNIQVSDDQIVKQEFAYIHLQKRLMTVAIELSSKEYKIIGNRFEPLEIPLNEITTTNYKDIRKQSFTNHYLKLRFKNLKTKIKRYIKHNTK